MSKSRKKSSNNRMKIVVIILIILLVVALGFIIYILTRPDETDEADNGGRGTVVTEDNADDINLNQEPVEDGMYETSMTIDWHFEGTKSEDAYVANVENNTRTVYFDLNLAETGETIYSSPYIPVGSELSGLTLEKELDPGTYDTILIYHLVDDDNKELSTLSVALTIYVE